VPLAEPITQQPETASANSCRAPLPQIAAALASGKTTPVKPAAGPRDHSTGQRSRGQHRRQAWGKHPL